MKKSALAAIVIMLATTINAQIIDEFRGLGRTGVFPEKKLLEQWPAEGPEMLWSVEKLPQGHSSMTIAYNTIYLTGTIDTLDYVVALDMNGNLKWQKPYGRSWNKSFPRSRCTPTIENKRLYISSGIGDLACVDAMNGDMIWQLKASDKFAGSYGPWGIAESLIVKGEKLFFTPGGNETTMVALNKNTGETIWKSESLKDNPSYTSPLWIEDGDKKQIVNVSQNYIFGVNPDDGTIVWKFSYGEFAGPPYHSNINTNTPLFYKNALFVTNGYNHTNLMLELDNAWKNVILKWKTNDLDTHHGGVVKVGGYIYGSNWINNGMGNWVCLDWETGELKYETKWFNKGSIITADGMLYCYDEKFGNIGIAKATPDEFKVISSMKITLGEKGPFWSHPVIKDGILYVRHLDAVMAFDIAGE